MGFSRPYSLQGIPEGPAPEHDEQKVQAPADCTERQHSVCPPFSPKNTDHGCQVQSQSDRAVDHTRYPCPDPLSPEGHRKTQGEEHEE